MTSIRKKAASAVGVAATAAVAAAVLGASPAQAEGVVLGLGEPDAIDNQFIVVLEDEATTADSLLASVDAELSKEFSIINGFSAEMSEADATALAGQPSVKYVTQNRTVTVAETQEDPPSWGLDRIDQTETAGDGSYTYPDTAGEGVTAYVLDTGIEADHPDFGDRVSEGTDTTGEGPGDGHGHGTHVAGTVAGTEYGVAKAAELVEVKVLDSAGSGTFEGVIEGIEWVTENADGPSVANMSLGGAADPAVDDAVTASTEAGIVYSLAAGNEYGADACNSSPAGAEGALTVGSSNEADTVSVFSNVGECVDLFAPGEEITSAWIGGGEDTISGTSMAAPHVAGAAALHLGENPDATVEEVNDAIVDNALEGVLDGVPDDTANLLLNIEYLNNGDGDPGDPGECVAEETSAVDLPDGATVDSTVAIECGESASADAEVSVDITHTYSGDLSITLTSPAGESFELKQQDLFDSTPDVNETYVVDLSGQEADGEWTLTVQDHFVGDTGTLNSWELAV